MGLEEKDVKVIRQGLEAAVRQLENMDKALAEVLAQIKKLVEQRGALQAFILHGRALLGEVGKVSTIHSPSPALGEALKTLADIQRIPSMLFDVMKQRNAGVHGVGTESQPIWLDAAAIIAKAQCPLTVPEIVEGMKAIGKSMTGENVIEVVRVALNRRREVFENMGRGRYALKVWPQEWKTRAPADGPADIEIGTFLVEAKK